MALVRWHDLMPAIAAGLAHPVLSADACAVACTEQHCSPELKQGHRIGRQYKLPQVSTCSVMQYLLAYDI